MPRSSSNQQRRWRAQMKLCSATASARSPSLTTRASLRSEEHTSELQSPCNLVCRLLLEKKKISTVHILQLIQSARPLIPDTPADGRGQSSSVHPPPGPLRPTALVLCCGNLVVMQSHITT